MKRNLIIITILVLTSLVVAACSTTPTDTPAAPTAAEMETKPPAAPTAEDMETEPTAEPTDDQHTESPGKGDLFTIIPGESQVSYEVGEVFLNQDNAFATAIGVTGIIKGDVTVDMENPGNSSISTIVVDISDFTSDSSRRDNAIRDRFLMSLTYPDGTFMPTSIDGLPDSYTEGDTIAFQVTGDLTVKETTRPVTFDVTVRVSGNTLTGEAAAMIMMSDFDVGPISIAGILETEDEVKLTFSIVAKSD